MTLPNGTPIWFDLGNDNPEEAQRFYGDLFGWTFEDRGPNFHHYHLITQNGGYVGGLMNSKMSPEGELDEAPYPNHWAVYLSTDHIETAYSKVEKNGGVGIFGPMWVGEMGAMALAKDSAGAEVGFWQPGTMSGYEFTAQPGTPVWFENMSRDFDVVLPFYRNIFDWKPSFMEGAEESSFRYATNFKSEQGSAGICEADGLLPEGVPSHWRIFFRVEDADVTARRAVELGGRMLGQPQDNLFGRVASLKDSTGAPFMIIQTVEH